VIVASRSPVCKRGVLVGLVHVGCRGGAKVQYPVDTVAQKNCAHEKERELPTFKPAEETQERMLPPTTRHCATSYHAFLEPMTF